MTRCTFNLIDRSIQPCAALLREVTPNRKGGWTPLALDGPLLLYRRATSSSGVPMNYCPLCGVDLRRGEGRS